MRPVAPGDASYRRFVKFYAPKARGEYDFRLYDEVDPFEAAGPDGLMDEQEEGSFMLMGWSPPLRVEVQGRDLGPVLERCAEFLHEAGARLMRAANYSLAGAMQQRMVFLGEEGVSGDDSRREVLARWAAKALGPA